MIRFLLAPALGVLGLGAAAAYLGPDLLIAPHGEPLILAKAPDDMFAPASLSADDCRPTLLFAEAASSGARIVAFAFRPDPEEVAVAVEDYADPASRPAETVVLIFDKDGRVVAAGDPQSLHLAETGCLPSDPDPGAPV